MLAFLASLMLTADWAAAAKELPELKTLGPVPADDALKTLTALHLKVGGKCRRLDFVDGKARADLDSGLVNGHSWRWSVEVTLGAKVIIEGPTAVHGLDRVGDTRTFTHAPEKGPITGAPGPIAGDELPIYPEARLVELKCWGTDGWTLKCPDGGTEDCLRCSTLRLIGSYRGGHRQYGDGVIRVTLGRDCGGACTGSGLRMRDFDALAAVVAARPVVDLKATKVARLFTTQKACAAAADPGVAPSFTGGEPKIP